MDPNPPPHTAALLSCPSYRLYDFGPAHPLRAERLDAGLDLLRTAGLLRPEEEVCPPPATDAELELIHTPGYVEALGRLSQWAPLTEPPLEAEARRWGLGAGDNPVYAEAYEAAAAIAGGSLAAVRALLAPPGTDRAPLAPDVAHVFHPMGGLHHALPDRASGFCLCNDPAVGIAGALREHEARVLYVDLDVHHGDGVQACFYDDPRVLTVSFHESGEFLFPGTGGVLEIGQGAGRGFSVNVPVAPGTGDGSWQAALEAVLPPLAERFRPDLIVSQHGCDTHVRDHLADLALTTASFEVQAAMLHRLAHEHCAGRWLATGGGGYDVFGVVPRAWSLLWAEMAGRAVPERLPAGWLARWQPRDHQPLPERFRDPAEAAPSGPAVAEAARRNERTVERVRRLVVPQAFRLAYTPPALRADALSAAVPGVVRLTGAMPETRTGTLQTPRGHLLLRDWCPPSLVRRLRADAGLVAFTRDPERELELLARGAAHPDTCLTLAHTPDGVIVGQVTICAPEGRWGAVEGVLELALETSRTWRRSGVARGLLAFALAPEWIEHTILVAEGYYWHWDTEGAGTDIFGYRALLSRLLGSVGFVEERTDEPDIAASPANVLLVRFGSRVSEARRAAFTARLRR